MRTDMRDAATPHAEILPVLEAHLAANCRSVDREIAKYEGKLVDLRAKAILLKAIAREAGIAIELVAEDAPDPLALVREAGA